MQSNLQLDVKRFDPEAFSPSPNSSKEPSGLHVALIMDGNGRWATQRKMPRLYGHKMGVEAVRKVIEKAPSLKIGMLTLYAFSSDNWARPQEETDHLFSLLERYLKAEIDTFIRQGIRLVFIGRRDRIPQKLHRQIELAEHRSRQGKKLVVRIALDYSARHQILTALAAQPHATEESLSRALSGIDQAWPVDLLIRTSGEQRLSDFLLWECAYAEFLFSPIHWPDFDGQALADAIETFTHRDRRFGAIKP